MVEGYGMSCSRLDLETRIEFRRVQFYLDIYMSERLP